MKTETKHTPGPWKVSIRRDGLGQAENRHSFEIVHDCPTGGQQVIVGKHTGIDCLTEANAALIASAPAMLEELATLRADKAELIDGCNRGLAYALAAALDYKPHFTQKRGECANYDAACDLADQARALIAKHTKP